jgi:hypothetical protein
MSANSATFPVLKSGEVGRVSRFSLTFAVLRLIRQIPLASGTTRTRDADFPLRPVNCTRDDAFTLC